MATVVRIEGPATVVRIDGPEARRPHSKWLGNNQGTKRRERGGGGWRWAGRAKAAKKETCAGCPQALPDADLLFAPGHVIGVCPGARDRRLPHGT
jgi:hypothetical protein